MLRTFLIIFTFCLKKKIVSLESGIQEAMTRYSVVQKWILEPLTYFNDIEVVPVEWLNDNELTQEEVKTLILKEVEKL